MSTVLAAARVCRRAAIFGVSPTASIDHVPLSPISPTTTGPEQTPTREARVTGPEIFITSETISRAAWTVRRAASLRATRAPPEAAQHALAEIARALASIASDRRAALPPIRVDKLLDILRIQGLRELR